MLTLATAAGNVELATITSFSQHVFSNQSVADCGKKYPQLLVVGILVYQADPETILSRGPFTLTRTPEGVVIAGTYQAWKSVIPGMLQDANTAPLAGSINTLFARLGLSCR